MRENARRGKKSTTKLNNRNKGKQMQKSYRDMVTSSKGNDPNK